MNDCFIYLFILSVILKQTTYKLVTLTFFSKSCHPCDVIATQNYQPLHLYPEG